MASEIPHDRRASTSAEGTRATQPTGGALATHSLAAILPGIDGFLFLLEPDGRIIDFHVGQAGELYLPPEQFLGRTIREVLPLETAARIMHGLERLPLGEAEVIEYTLPYPDGIRTFEARLTPLAGSLCLAIVSQVTRRVRAEQSQREVEARLQQAVRVGKIGIFDHDHVADSIYWSPEQRAIYGWGPDEPVTLQRFVEQVHPEDRERIQRAVRRAHDPAGDGLFDVEHRVIRRDGETRWLATRSLTLFGGAGAERGPLRTIGAVVDVSDQHEADARLRASEERFRTLIEEGSDLVVTFDPSGRFTYLSPAVRAVLGYAPEELLGASLGGLIHPDDAAVVMARMAAVLTGEQPTLRTSARLRHKDGSWRTLDGIARNLCHLPAIGAIVANARDITEQRQLEERLLEADRLESIGRLAGGIAHDFNNILTAILGYAELLHADAVAGRPSRIDDLIEVRGAGQRARDLTAQLLAFARRQVISPRPVELNEIIRKDERMLRRLLGEDVELSTSLAPELWRINVDPTQIEQVVLNLAINARDAMPAGGKLTVETENVVLSPEYAANHGRMQSGPHAMLAVSDTGSGIPPEALPHIFEPFFTTKPAGAGTGLGLATVYGIVRQSGGHIWVYSEPGVGTTFKVYFPRVSDEPVPAVPEPTERRGPAVGTETILVVEDDASVRALIVRALRESGYSVLMATNPHDAMALAAATPETIHLLVSDVVMPRMSGKALADALALERPSMRVLFVSGYTANTIVHHGVLDSGVNFLPKPFTPSALVDRVREVLDAASRPE